MKTFTTYQEYLSACTERTANSHRPPVAPYNWTCETCGKVYSHNTPYGILRNPERMHCYACCHAKDIAELLDRSKPFGAYLSSDAKNVSAWLGTPLAKVYACAYSPSGWHGSNVWRFTAKDVHGAWWAGRDAGPGMYCTLRAMKHAPKYTHFYNDVVQS